MVYQDRDRSLLLIELVAHAPDSAAMRCENGLVADANGFCYDLRTWRWTGASWERQDHNDPNGVGQPRRTAATAIDGATGTLWAVEHVVYEAEDDGDDWPVCADGSLATDNGECMVVNVWSWDGHAWSHRVPPHASQGDAPGLGLVAGLVFEPALGGLVLFELVEVMADPAGDCWDGRPPPDPQGHCPQIETWRWEDERWVAVEYTDPTGDGHATVEDTLGSGSFALVHDAAAARVVLLPSVIERAEVWTFDGSDWQHIEIEGDPAVVAPSGSLRAAVDPARDAWVVVTTELLPERDVDECPDGYSNLARHPDRCAMAQRWDWTGRGWARTDAPGPVAVGLGLLAGVEATGSLFLYSEHGEAWALDANSWSGTPHTDLENDGNPGYPSPVGSHLAVDPSDGLVRLMDEGLLWSWEPGADASPSHVFRASFGAAQAPGDAAVEQVEVAWRAGGRGGGTSAPADGVSLHVWDTGRWVAVASNDAALDAPETVAWSTDDGRRLRRLLVGDERHVGFALTPAGPNGSTGPRAGLVTEHVELRVRYRLQ